MRVLLMSMPDAADSFEFFVRMPNLGLVSLAGSLEGHDIRVVDLVAFRKKVRRVVEEEIREPRPGLVGLTAMTFQFHTLLKIARFIRKESPGTLLAAGGYHVTTSAPDIVNYDDLPLDFLVRGEGEATFKELVGELERPAPDFSGIPGLSFRAGGEWVHNPARPPLDLGLLPRPRRGCRRPANYFLLNKPVEVVETSRGCPHSCRFCSIGKMYGRIFRAFPIDRVVEDLRDIRSRGAKAVFFSDDNITNDVPRFREICQSIAREGLDDICYIAQVSAAGVASDPGLAADMARANFHSVFVGFEAMDAESLRKMKKPASPEVNVRAARLLKRNGIGIVAGCIFGRPEEDARSIRRDFELVRSLRPDVILSQFLTPYPGTVVREDLLGEGLVENVGDFKYYHGMHCSVRSRFLSRAGIHRRLRFQNLLSCFDPRLIWGNKFLKMFPLRFSGAILSAMWRHLRGTVTGRQPCDDFRLDR